MMDQNLEGETKVKEEPSSKTRTLSEVTIELDQTRLQVRSLQRELDEAKSQVAIAQYTAENDVDIEKRKCQEEIATVQQIMKEELMQADEEINVLKRMVHKGEIEKQSLREAYHQKVEECDIIQKKANEGLLNPISVMTKSIAKRVPSLSPAHTTPPTVEKPGRPQSGSGIPSTSPVAEQPQNMEESMQKAQEDAEVLKSLVVPLEEEIHALKDKIREQDAELRAKESQEQMGIKTSEVLGPLFQGKSPEDLVRELDEKLQGVRSTLEVEKASRADLELYTAILNAQKAAIADSVERLKEQLADVRRQYESMRKSHTELKNTWQRANDQFLGSQRRHLEDMRRLKSLLDPGQLKMFYEMQRMDSKEEDLLERGKLSPMGDDELLIEDSKYNLDVNRDELTEEEEEEAANDELLADNCAASLLDSKYSPDKMPQLTDDQKRALSALETEGEEEFNLTALGKQAADEDTELRCVSEKEWRKMIREIERARQRIPKACQFCEDSDTGFKKMDLEMQEKDKKIEKLSTAIERQKEELQNESLYRKQAEEKWLKMAQEYEKKEKMFHPLIERISSKHLDYVNLSQATIKSIQDQLKRLTENREFVNKELVRLQQENDKLVGKHSQHSETMQNEIINLPDKMEEMHLLLLRYREDIIAAKVAKETSEENLNSRILFLKDQVLSEQHEKSSIEDRLSTEIDQLRKRLAELEGSSQTLEEERNVRMELEIRAKTLEDKSREITVRSQQFITGLKSQLDEQIKKTEAVGQELSEAKARISTLQKDLETSEGVQRDFVRLSQSLQVQLERIRQSGKEVRWQHEEDVEECNMCKQRFTAVGRRKHHCRHCGKIFCTECCSRSVPSGPNRRMSKVCDVCHTLLVSDATPFFSVEPPHSPD